MRKQRACSVLCAFLFFVSTTSAQIPGELPIINPGFEAGDKSGWFEWSEGGDFIVEIVSDITHSGNNAARISGESGAFYKSITDELLPMVPGTFYCFVAETFISLDDPLQEGQNLYLASKITTSSGEEWFESAKKVTFTDNAGMWQQLSFGLECPPDVTAITVEFKWTGTGAGTPGSVYVDDVKIVRMEPPESLGDFGVEDPDDQLYGWDGGWWSWAYLPIEPPEGEETWIDSTISHGGKRSVAMVPQDWNSFSDDWFWGGFYTWTGITAFDTVNYYHEGDAFYMGAWVMHSSDDPLVGEVNVQIELSFKDINGENLSNLGYSEGRAWSPKQLDETMPTDEWHRLEMYIECPPLEPETIVDRIDLVMRLYQWGPAWGVVYIDDVFMAKGTPPPSVVENKKPVVPAGVSLMQNYPNPFNPKTNIRYSIPVSSKVELAVFDLLGKKVETLVDEEKLAGTHDVTFDGSDYANGIFFYKLTTETQAIARKMVLVK
ncbi:T9SS type A sorting domain-containing protein [candidate division KSB1 bacterium]|nr:T9SS type A sorting domain-containing protein [candidate division KSB1 bacterium]